MLNKKNIVVVTGTRADFGKMLSILSLLQKSKNFNTYIFVTGMHLLKKYGYTIDEIKKSNFKNIIKHNNQKSGENDDVIFHKTFVGFSNFLKKKMDLVIVHGDRLETLATCTAALLNNIPIAHIEGGEVSGTRDEIIRHSVSKLSTFHFVSNDSAKKRLIQMGEQKKNIFKIGSPEVDIFSSKDLPSISEVKKRYGIKFEKFSILIFHPDNSNLDRKNDIEILVSAILNTNINYVVIYPNNDMGSQNIINKYEKNFQKKNFKMIRSMRFSFYIRLLMNSEFIIGNSSSGVREAPSLGVRSINIGDRQFNRAKASSIINCKLSKKDILKSIKKVNDLPKNISLNFGKGNSSNQFLKILNKKRFWVNNKLKTFVDLK